MTPNEFIINNKMLNLEYDLVKLHIQCKVDINKNVGLKKCI